MLTNLENLEHFPEGGRVENRKQLDFAKKSIMSNWKLIGWGSYISFATTQGPSFRESVRILCVGYRQRIKWGKNMDKHGGGLRDVRD